MEKADLIYEIRRFAAEKFIDDLVAAELGNYVYGLYADIQKNPFYIGKGTGSRVLTHFSEVIDALSGPVDKTPETVKLLSILESFVDGVAKPEIRIIRRGLDEAQAFAVEGALIDMLQPLGNKVRGIDSLKSGMISLDELNNVIGAKPLYSEENYPLIFLYNIEGGYRKENDFFEALRGHWKWRKSMGEVSKIQGKGGRVLAVGLMRGISRCVIEIERWEKSASVEGRYEIKGKKVDDSELLHRKWNQIIDSGSWKFGTGMILAILQENGVPGFQILMGNKIKGFQEFKR